MLVGTTRRVVVLVALMLLGSHLMAAPATAGDVLVVCPQEFRLALAPWLQHRRKQGRQVTLLSADGTAAQIQARVRQASQDEPPGWILLVGDVPPQDADAAALPKTVLSQTVPTFHVPAKVIQQFGSEKDIASDNGYADLDGDGAPDAAIGRLTCDTAEELRLLVDKILAHERSAAAGPWCRRLNFIAGLGGFGLLADAAMETCTKKFLTEGIPAQYATSMTYASWRSPYCPDPRRFRQTTLARLNQGSLFWVYIGHGGRQALDYVASPGGKYFPIMSARDVPFLDCRQGAPIALFLSCYTGAFDDPKDCLAEELIRRDGGPVAVISGSRVTMPYGMAVLGHEMLRECFTESRPTLGEVLLHAKRSSLDPELKGENRQLLEFMARALNQHSDLEGERREHVNLFNLIGDPLLRMPRPQQVEITAPEQVEESGTLQVSGMCNVDGTATVELIVRRDRFAFQPVARQAHDDEDALLAQQQAAYIKANDPRLLSVQVPVRDGQLEVELRVPQQCAGPCHVRVFVQGQEQVALGSKDVMVLRLPKTALGE